MKKKTKMEIAVSSLNSAYRMFLEKDYVASTLLAGAGQQILRDLCKSRGIETTITTLSANLGHSIKDILACIVDPYNQMKHANRFPNDLEISEKVPVALMRLAWNDLMSLDEKQTKEMEKFMKAMENLRNELI